MAVLIKPEERVDDLQRNGLLLIQNPKGFCFGTDAVLLANFCRLRPCDRVVDFGTGTGILPLLLSQNEPSATFDALEIQPDMAEMAGRSVLLNRLEGRIRVRCDDLRVAPLLLGKGETDVVVCNPPYGQPGGTVPNRAEEVAIARHEQETSLDEILQSAEELLRYRGRLFLVFPANRMMDLLFCLRQHRMEPKRIRTVQSKPSKPPYIILIEAVKQGNPFLRWDPPMIVYDENGNETEETKRIYHREAQKGE